MQLNSSIQYNILTGMTPLQAATSTSTSLSSFPKDSNVVKLPPCRKYLGARQKESPFLQHEGTIQLRESFNRFYRYYKHDIRRTQVCRKGELYAYIFTVFCNHTRYIVWMGLSDVYRSTLMRSAQTMRHFSISVLLCTRLFLIMQSRVDRIRWTNIERMYWPEVGRTLHIYISIYIYV